MFAAELKILPIGTGSSMEHAMERVAAALDQKGIEYDMGPLGTTLESKDLDQLFLAVRAAHDALASDTPRIFLELAIDHRIDKEETLRSLEEVKTE